MMIATGRDACFMRDKKGYLPAHVACSRHCSPEKLQMLLNVNPDSLAALTNDGQTLLALAMSTATKSHPNYALIEELQRKLDEAGVSNANGNLEFPVRVSSDETNYEEQQDEQQQQQQHSKRSSSRSATTMTTCKPKSTRAARKRTRKVTADDADDPANLLLHFSRHTDKRIKLIAKVEV
jgi:hypothetical protein